MSVDVLLIKKWGIGQWDFDVSSLMLVLDSIHLWSDYMTFKEQKMH